MQIIPNWLELKLTCESCGKTKSVKYKGDDGKIYCNACVWKEKVKTAKDRLC